MSAPVSPDEAVFRAHLAGGRFRSGAAAGRWRLVAVAWPHAVFGVRAADGAEYGLRFECSDYPRTPPTAGLWDLELNAPLAVNKWPAGRDRIPLAFNPGWKNGACLYLPCDRISIEGHANWYQQHPSLVWDPAIGIAHYLRVVHDLVNSSDYGGRRAA
ncbi:MAG TPA: hypothetical protein VFA57_12795 [Pseudolabrys sp.]|nr:hypothetical protein [Pseudolabrys sp.]